MDRAGALRILLCSDEFCDNLFRFDKTKLLDAKLNEELSNMLGGVRLRRELEAFLESVQIARGSFVLDWISFMRLYGEVIMDVPLVISARPRVKRRQQQPIEIKHLKSVVVKTENTAGAFRLNWRLHYAHKPPIDCAPVGPATVFPIRDAGDPNPSATTSGVCRGADLRGATYPAAPKHAASRHRPVGRAVRPPAIAVCSVVMSIISPAVISLPLSRPLAVLRMSLFTAFCWQA